jgi:hypothetical protein
MIQVKLRQHGHLYPLTLLLCSSLLVKESLGFSLSKVNVNVNRNILSSSLAPSPQSSSSSSTALFQSMPWDNPFENNRANRRKERTNAADGQAEALKRRSVTLPLIDLTSSDSYSKSANIITPLPASHLPSELSTIHVYGMTLTAAIHKMMITDTLKNHNPTAGSTADSTGMGMSDNIFATGQEPMYGHLISKCPKGDDNGNDSLIGAIGCASEILFATPSTNEDIHFDTIVVEPTLEEEKKDDDDEFSDFSDPLNENSGDVPLTVLTKGSFRFIVRNITQSFPYPIAIVDELLDDLIVDVDADADADIVDIETGDNIDDDDTDEMLFASIIKSKDDNEEEDDDDDDDDDDIYANLTPPELMQRTFSAMHAIIDQKLETNPKQISPLEISILEQNNLSPSTTKAIDSMKINQAEEMAAVLDIFLNELYDIAPSKRLQYYVVCMIASEIGGLDNGLRRDMLVSTNGVERLRFVVEALEKKISLVQAKKLTEDIVEKSDEDSKNLKVGKPSLPPWAKSLTKGMKIEYYWSEQDGWLAGTIVDSTMIIDELIITVKFEDGETVRLPFDPEEKVRWRPLGM